MGKNSCDRIAETRQDNWDRTAKEDSRNCTGRTGKRGQDSQNITAMTHHLVQDNLDGTTVAGHQ
jgi:hypothetical protein